MAIGVIYFVLTLSILYLRCIIAVTLAAAAFTVWTFNSLFEMRTGGGPRPRRGEDKFLSILYLRCLGFSKMQAVRALERIFQFSI